MKVNVIITILKNCPTFLLKMIYHSFHQSLVEDYEAFVFSVTIQYISDKKLLHYLCDQQLEGSPLTKYIVTTHLDLYSDICPFIFLLSQWFILWFSIIYPDHQLIHSYLHLRIPYLVSFECVVMPPLFQPSSLCTLFVILDWLLSKKFFALLHS